MKNFFYLFIAAGFLLISCNSEQNPRVMIETEMGNIEVEIFEKEAPITAANFLNHVDSGTYNNGACFYRVVRMDNQPNNDVKIEVVQCGLYRNRSAREIPPIAHENTEMTGIKHLNGSLSMARWGPGTATTEFSICIGDQPEMDYGGQRNADGQGFAAFGKVVKGMEVAHAIQTQKDTNQYLMQPIKILAMKRVK